MQERTATLNLDSDAAMNPPAIEPVFEREPRGGANRFTYPSGARPLEGYTLKRGIGHGGFGEVYYATSDAGKEVALKLIRRNLSIELRGVMQCLNLKHPNLVALYDIKHDASDDTWVVMEYVGGECLEDVIARHPQGLPADRALAWMHGICAGVAYLHDRGIVHRDLKPGNLFNDEGLVKIGDYGLSKFISASRRSGQTESVGTVHYMAPEVANGRYGKEIDIYALGVILYELLTGRVPFEGESVGEVLMKHLTAQPDVTCLSEPYRGIVARALEKDPEKRLSSVGELIALLPPPPAGATQVQPTLAAAGVYGDALKVTGPWENPTQPSATRHAPPPLPLQPPSPLHRILPGEPVWTATRDALLRTWHAWVNARIGLVPKVLLLLCFIPGVILVAGAMIGPLVLALAIYVLYLIFWLLTAPGAKLLGHPVGPPIGWPSRRPAPPAPPQSPVAQVVGPPPVPQANPRDACVHQASWQDKHRAWHAAQNARCIGREEAAAALVLKPARERLADLFGSYLLAALVAALSTVVVSIFKPQLGINDLVGLGLVSTLGAWALLTASKFWEGTEGEPMLRRLVLLGIGLGLGAAAFAIDQSLLIEPIYNGPQAGYGPQIFPNNGIGLFASSGGKLLLPMYLAYFGFLFPVLQWWQQADPLRKERLNLWSIGICVLWAGILSNFWQFPQPEGMLVAGTISAAIQLSAPWIDRRRRGASEASA